MSAVIFYVQTYIYIYTTFLATRTVTEKYTRAKNN